MVPPAIQSSTVQRRFVTVTCGACNTSVSIDVTDYHTKMTVTDVHRCSKGHFITISVRQGKVISKSTQKISDIDKYLDVPDYIKEIVKEAYKCSGMEAPKAGASMVRLLLDDFLYELGSTQRMCWHKVNSLENRCQNNAAFERSHRALCRRIPLFRTICGLGGFHVHAQGRSITDVIQSEFDGYLAVVEGAIKENWPRRSP